MLMPTCAIPIQGKSAALKALAPHLLKATVPEFLTLPCTQLHKQLDGFVQQVMQLGGSSYAVRSDAWLEDQAEGSQAGHFLTLLDVSADHLKSSIQQVAQSLPGHPLDQVMVQCMVSTVALAGVASTHRISDGAPWYCIELAAGDSAAVTAGRAQGRMYGVARAQASLCLRKGELEPQVALPLALLLELEAIRPGCAFEIEFVLTPSQEQWQLHLLQCRPIAAQACWPLQSTGITTCSLPSLAALQQADLCAQVLGSSTLYTLMSDWNPAELIGSHPRPLALSLFQALIARGTWWQARERLGYAPAPQLDVALLRPLAGRPWVDLRRSANSLIPAGVPGTIVTRLVDLWLARLRSQPHLHDKVEFNLFRTVRDFLPLSEVQAQYGEGLDHREVTVWEDHLGKLGRGLLNTTADNPLALHVARIKAALRTPLQGRPWPALLQHSRNTALAFAVLARIAFVAQSLLRSAVDRGALDDQRATALKIAARSTPLTCVDETSTHSWSTLHGGMRAGSFDITQPTWAEQSHLLRVSETVAPAQFVLHDVEARGLMQLLAESGYLLSPTQWVQFVQQATRWREWGKFALNRQLSALLDGIALELGAAGIEREQASWLTLEHIQTGLALPLGAREQYWLEVVRAAKALHAREAQVLVSPLLCRESDRYHADSLGLMPNFIGHQVAEGKVVLLDDRMPRVADRLNQAIVVLSQADPGYDWLFQHPIRGLITAWGGANSHMGIRCAEFGLSAAMGCGEAVLRQASRAQHARIDPSIGGLWLN